MKAKMTKVELFEMFKTNSINYISVLAAIYENGGSEVWDAETFDSIVDDLTENIVHFGEDLGLKLNEDLDVI